jgi:uncharacterized membrane protein
MTTLSDRLPAAFEEDLASTRAATRGAAQSARPEGFVNVGQTERRVSTIAGGALAVFGLSRGSLPGLLLAGLGGAMVFRGLSGHCHAYKALGIDTNHDAPAEPHEYFEHGVHVEQLVTVMKPADELYRFWRNFENLPRFMSHLESVQVLDDRRSRWTAKGPAGSNVTWDAEIINEEDGRLIAWRSLQGADVDNAGSVRFIESEGGRGTQVRVVLDYIPPAGGVGAWVARMFGEDPSTQIKDDLRRFKQLMEAGEIPTTEGQSSATSV